MPLKTSKKAIAKLPKKERMASHIMVSEIKSGKNKKEAESIAYATMNKRKKK
jgi:hypothetical protein